MILSEHVLILIIRHTLHLPTNDTEIKEQSCFSQLYALSFYQKANFKQFFQSNAVL